MSFSYQDADSFIRGELRRSGLPFDDSRPNDFRIHCIDPLCSSHKKKGFKLEIARDGTKAHCWVCDARYTWNSLAAKLGLLPLEKSGGSKPSILDEPNQRPAFSNLSKDLDNSFKTEETTSSLNQLPLDIKPWKGINDNGLPWRGLTVDFLSTLPAYYWSDTVVTPYHSYTTPRILLPYYQKGNLVGYGGRRLDTDQNIRYKNANWARAKKVLFPFDLAANLKSPYLFLVEGQIDALWLLQNGIPALCILGTQNWSTYKINLLLLLGIKKVFLLMDGDDAGKKATESILYGKKIKKGKQEVIDYPPLGDYFETQVVELPEGTDPAQLTIKQLDWIKNLV